jgi:hypothetical protein
VVRTDLRRRFLKNHFTQEYRQLHDNHYRWLRYCLTSHYVADGSDSSDPSHSTVLFTHISILNVTVPCLETQLQRLWANSSTRLRNKLAESSPTADRSSRLYWFFLLTSRPE